MKNIFILVIVMMSGISHAQTDRKLSLDPAKVEWFKEARFGMFIHWGLYSMLEGSYNGHTLPDTSMKQGKSWYAEWVQMRLEVPTDEYRNLAKNFNPIGFNADQWIAEAKNAGMKYFVITAKHHDGFALWDSKVSDFDIMSSPFKRDIIGELVQACKKVGMKYGFYYSHWQDWEYPGGALPYWLPERPDTDFEHYWQKKCLPQVKELLVKYNPDLLWFDTWDQKSHITSKRRDELIALVRNNSSKCLINGRISFFDPGENVDFLEMHDNSYPNKILEKPWQTPATMVHSWGWHANDFNWKSSSQMLGYLVSNASKGGNYLLNIGPKPDGTYPIPAVRRLREMGAWTHANNSAIYGTQPVKIDAPKGVYLTQKIVGNHRIISIFFSQAAGSHIELPVDATTIAGCEILESGMPIRFSASGSKTRFDIPKELTNDNFQVISVQLKSKQ